MCFKTIEAYPCECGANASAETGAVLFPIKTTYSQRPLGITTEEFGVELFETIKAASARSEALKTAAVFQRKGLTRKAEEYRTRAAAYEQEVTRLLHKGTAGSPDDVRRILAIE
jgi:hypothetical protein